MGLTDADWRKSKRSGENGGNCVEVTAVEAKTDDVLQAPRDHSRN